MKATNVLMCAGMAICCTGAAMADKPKLQTATAEARLVPVSVQRAILNADGSVTTVGELIPYEGGSSRTNWGIAFDNFEPDSTGFPTDGASSEGYDPECFGPGATNRWFFGTGYNNKLVANDMVTNPDNDGQVSERMLTGFYMSADEINLQIGVWTAQSFSADCSGFDSDGDGVPDLGVADLFDGVIYTFGFVGVGGWYIVDADLAGTGLSHQLPTGPGGYLIGYYGDDDFDGVPDRQATAGQTMLWGTEKIGNLSHQDLMQWDDDTPPEGDGIHTAPDECYFYDLGVCPDPLGAMIAFYGGGEPPCFADCDGSGTVNTLDFLCFLNQFSAGDPAADCDGSGAINTLDFLCFLNAFNSGC